MLPLQTKHHDRTNFMPNRRSFRLVLLCLGCCVLSSLSCHLAQAADQKHWDLSSYRVQLHLAVDVSQRPQPKLGEQLAAKLQQQIRATLYPLWKTEIHLATGAEKQRLLTQLETLDQDTSEDAKQTEALVLGCDKQIYMNIVVTPLGATLKSREFDCTTRRWSRVHERKIRQAWMLPMQCFQLICDTFAPLATIRPIEDDDKNITLHFRGSDLPTQVDLSSLNVLGEAYQPLRVRTRSNGEIKADSIREIPWTYLSLTEHNEKGWIGAIHTGTRRPFGIRRRGRVEHLALAIRKPTGKTVVRFFARHDKTRSLSGYEVFRREPLATESQALGLTNTKGSLDILPGPSNVTVLFLRSEGQLLAKLPVVPGAKQLVEIPIADDTARLRAQAALTAITEQLIDTVAQRNILIARVNDRLKQGKIEEAQDLFTTLDNLEGLTHFDSLIKAAKNSITSEDDKVQARIDKLFTSTRKLLGRFLSNKQISNVQDKITAARRSS